MAPSPQENGIHAPPSEGRTRPPPGEEVVISGISGIFPSSDNTTEFLENLYNNVDLVTENDLNFHHPEAPRHLGQINGLTKFDAQFFRVTYQHAMTMEPVSRKLLEQAYMAIYDSGVNPLALKGKKVGVFIGTSYSDTSNVAMYYASNQKGFVLSGCGKSMFANRISYWIDAKGPSFSLDCSHASSMVCLEHAYQAMINGECEAAIVGGGNICKLPQIGLNLRKGGMACLDGKTKCFDAHGDGPVRAEAINCIFLQKAKDAKRVYAEVYYAHVTYGLRDDAHFLPNRRTEEIAKFFKKIYSNIDISPKEVDYIEANGSAIAEADTNELKAIAEVFASEQNIVKVGSVRSYMGHAEPASGVCAITKVCLAYHKGKLPANLHYNEPVNVPALKEGKIKVLQNNEYFNRGYAAVNQFSMNGADCHVLLKGHFKAKDITKYQSSIPRLILVSGRQDECVNNLFKKLESLTFDPEVIGMLHNIYQIDTPGHTSRGYAILDTNEKSETVSLAKSAEYYSGSKRPLCLVFSGMGSQWPGMAADFMRIPIFANAIHKCHKTLEPFGVDLINVLTKPDKTIFDNILNCFIGISAVQIALTDVLKAIGLVPDQIIGHSQGEMCCAYWDDCFTTEEVILAAYSRGITCLESSFIKGGMAAVGLGFKDISPLCPPEIDVACHNSNESATLSGPADILNEFVAELQSKKMFAREVHSANIAFHSRYIRDAGPAFLRRLQEIIKKPKLRSEKWICTSIPQDKWNEDFAKYSSAEFHANNLLSPVFFEEGAQLIDKNAVVVEVAPHGLLQAILKRSHPECTHIPLTRRGHENPVKLLFESIGKLYQEGYNFKIDALYPEIQYPVSTDTQMISHFVDWEHSENWPEIVSNTKNMVTAISRELILSIQDDEFKYFSGYFRNGNNVLPESAILSFVWETLAMYKGVNYKDLSVVFNDVQFYGEAVILPEESLKLNFVINKGNDYFEVTQDEILLANGFVAEVRKLKFDIIKEFDEANDEHSWENDTILYSDDIYKHLHAKSLTYRGEFQSIHSTNFNRSTAKIKWEENWIILLDSLIQLNILARDAEGVAVPKIIKKLTISKDELNLAKSADIDCTQNCNAKFYNMYNVTRCVGIEIRHIIFENKPITQQEPDVLDSLVFIPYHVAEEVNINTAFQISLQIVADNVKDKIITVTELINDSSSSISNVLDDAANHIPNVKVELHTLKLKEANEYLGYSNLVVLLNLFKNGMNVNDVLQNLNKDAFILTFDQSDLKTDYFNVISSLKIKGKTLILLKKRQERKSENVTYLTIDDDEKFSWVPILERELLTTKRVVLVAERQPYCGIFGFVKSSQKVYPDKISLVMVDDYNAPLFDKNNSTFNEQLEKGLRFNILKKGKWGSYYYLQNEQWANVKNIKLVNAIPGNIDNLKWVEIPTLQTNKNLIQVCFAGTSIRDAQKAVGMVENDEEGLGCDFSGFDSNGERVMGLVSSGAIASQVQADPNLLWQVPNNWSLEDAATVPLPYIHACYCLVIKGQLLKEKSVFVTGGTGALGQAVISICLSLDCTVFTSVGDEHKKQFLLKLFPCLEPKNIGLSKNGDFYTMVKINTKAKGCDFVINCANGHLREAAMKCTAPYGIFMDVNDFDWSTNKPLGMSYIQYDRSYMAAKLSSIFRPDNVKERKMLQYIIAEGIKNGFVRPLTRVVYPTTEVSRAFRLLTSNRHRGRVLFKMRDAEISPKCLNIIPMISCTSNGTYVIVCDDTELGIEIANRIVKRGARRIMLHLRHKKVPGYAHLKFASWMKLGTQITLSTEKLDSDKDCAQFLNKAEKLGRVHGIFIIQESTAHDDSWTQKDFVTKYEMISTVVAKLDVISRNNCPELRSFVVISRSSSNAVDEYISSVSLRVCENRQKVGLSAVHFKFQLLEKLQADSLTDSRLCPQNMMTVLNALERSIALKCSSTITYNITKQRHLQFLDDIVRCLCVDKLDNVDSRLTVNDFVSNDIKLEELKAIIKDTCKVEYTAEKLRRLSISSLRTLSKKFSKQNNKFNAKLGAFYTFVDKDEYVATNAMIAMKTIINKDVETNELDENATHLLLIPGFEGHHEIFKPLCERLKVRAMTFQLVPDVITDSIPELANHILKLIKRNFVFTSKFYLLGYSFGVSVALEIAALLEKEGHVGVVYCLDSSPDALKVQLDAYIGSNTDSQLQNSIIEHFFHLMSGENSSELTEAIDKLDNWSAKLDVCINKLKHFAHYTNMYTHNVIDSAYKRILLAKNYKPNLSLESELVLLKGIRHPKSGNLASDYGLSKFAKKPVKVMNIASDHATAPQDCRISNIVNKFIDPELLEDKSNLCITYKLE